MKLLYAITGFAARLIVFTLAVMLSGISIVAFCTLFNGQIIMGTIGTGASVFAAWLAWSLLKELPVKYTNHDRF